MQVIYTPHARRRMIRRIVPVAEVQQVLDHPEGIRQSYAGRLIYSAHIGGRHIGVVITGNETPPAVLTVMYLPE